MKENQSPMEVRIQKNERLDDLNRKGYQIIQDPKRFCFGMDAVLLSEFARVKKGETVVDLGTGTGIIPILLEARNRGGHFIGLEIQKESVEMARRSVLYNHLEDKIEIVEGDIRQASAILKKSSAQVVISNPPYMKDNHGLTNDNEAMNIARHEILCTLEDVVREAAALLIPKGRFFMVHRPFRLVEIFGTLTKYQLEPKRVQFVYPYVDREPNMVLIEAILGGASRVTIEKPLIVYQDKGKYTDEFYKIYGY